MELFVGGRHEACGWPGRRLDLTTRHSRLGISQRSRARPQSSRAGPSSTRRRRFQQPADNGHRRTGLGDVTASWRSCKAVSEGQSDVNRRVLFSWSECVISKLEILDLRLTSGGSVAEWFACWTLAQKASGSNRSRDA